MTFNNSKTEAKKVPLIEDTVNGQFSQLQTLFLEFNKTYDELSLYNEKLVSMNRKDFDVTREL
jgi:hypothetical protein